MVPCRSKKRVAGIQQRICLRIAGQSLTLVANVSYGFLPTLDDLRWRINVNSPINLHHWHWRTLSEQAVIMWDYGGKCIIYYCCRGTITSTSFGLPTFSRFDRRSNLIMGKARCCIRRQIRPGWKWIASLPQIFHCQQFAVSPWQMKWWSIRKSKIRIPNSLIRPGVSIARRRRRLFPFRFEDKVKWKYC